MGEHSYRNFDLVIEPSDNGYQARVVESPAGEAVGHVTWPFTDEGLENFALRMGGARRTVRRMGSPTTDMARKFGRQLYDAVFAGNIELCLRQSLSAAENKGDGLRIRLRLNQVPELSSVPWEYLYSDHLGRFLTLSNATPLVRYLELGQPARPLQVNAPLRILVVASSPDDIEELDTQRELQLLQDATRDLVRAGKLEVHSLMDATLSSLQHQLRKGAFHILHFMGHGAFDERDGTGLLAFEDDHGRSKPVSGEELGMMLHDHPSLRMVVLNACEGSRTSLADPLGGVAQSLVRQGIPAVVAMQFEISDEAAVAFSQELYLALADGYPVDAATSEARKGVFAQASDVEWGTPVLHLRTSDGQIFDVREAPEVDDVDQLMAMARAKAQVADPAVQIAAIGLLKRVLTLAPGRSEAATLLARLQSSARLNPGVDTASKTSTVTGEPTTASPSHGHREPATSRPEDPSAPSMARETRSSQVPQVTLASLPVSDSRTEASGSTNSSAGWHPDPMGRHELRWWDGKIWTQHVFSRGGQSVDPLNGSEAAPSDSDKGPTDPGQAAAASAVAGWHPDPSGRNQLRWWDGNTWTEHVSARGGQATDPTSGIGPIPDKEVTTTPDGSPVEAFGLGVLTALIVATLFSVGLVGVLAGLMNLGHPARRTQSKWLLWTGVALLVLAMIEFPI